jgi:2,4-dienoyl-CoA reductase-like NADH-dependent reductase (Old Yellow Enzyme family)/dihydrodipicolinate synthase/N-acetylneuraminate lyase
MLSDAEIGAIVEEFHRAAKVAWNLGFDFVDIKHCHGYLGHEFLSAHTREGKYGGTLENRTRFLREIVQGIRAVVPKLQVGVRLSAFDTVPFRPDPDCSHKQRLGPGIPERHEHLIPYRWGFGLNSLNPLEIDLEEPIEFLSLLKKLGVNLVNITAGSPYYTPHIQRPALYPPSDGYQPPEDPLIGVARLMTATRALKQRFPDLIFVGSGYSYLQDFLPHVAQAALREGWVDCVGMGRMVLTYPELLWDGSQGRSIDHKRICRTFSDCTTAPRNGLPSGCYPLDAYYKKSEFAARLQSAKKSPSQVQVVDSAPRIETLDERRKLRRKVEGIAAALLPYEADGQVAVETFAQHLLATHRAGLMNAVNMDTGYVNYLGEAQKREVLRWTREALGKDVLFVAGAYIDNGVGDPVSSYRQHVNTILEFGGMPILFPSTQLHGKSAKEKEKVYREVCRGCPRVLAFELGSMFSACGERFDEETIRRFMDIPELVGMKHSSLNRLLELKRLELRDRHRPDFRIYTGNDLGINMIEYGSDYLLGLATLAPEKFAKRDGLWERGDPAYYELSDALQHLGNVVFRDPVPAYKHSAAIFLHMTGRIPSERTHPRNPKRPQWEPEILKDCARRLFGDDILRRAHTGPRSTLLEVLADRAGS